MHLLLNKFCFQIYNKFINKMIKIIFFHLGKQERLLLPFSLTSQLIIYPVNVYCYYYANPVPKKKLCLACSTALTFNLE